MNKQKEEPVDDTLKSEKLLAEKIGKLSESTVLGSVATLINATILVVILWPVGDKTSLLIWLSLIISISLLRLHLQKSFTNFEGSLASLNQWKNYFLITIAVSGGIWGIASLFLFPTESIAHQSFIAFVLGGMVAGSVGIFSSILRAFLVFSILALLPLAIRFFLIGDPIHLSMGFMLLLFWLIMFLTARRLNQNVLVTIQLKYENIDLISELETEVEIRKSAEAKLITQKEKIEKLVNVRTFELQESNKKLTHEIEERKLITKELKESEEKYRDLVENINDILFSVDLDGVLTYISPVAEPLLGYTPSEVVGKMFSGFICPEDLPSVLDRFKAALSGTVEAAEYRIVLKSGESKWMRSASRAISKGGKVVGMRGALVDISERKRFEMERTNLEAQLQQARKMESIGTLAGGVAHDFNNILYMIIGNTELAMELLPNPNPALEMLEDIKAAGLRAAGIVKQLLEFSRNTKHDLSPMDAVSVIKNSLSLLRSTIPSFIELHQHLPETELTILANPIQINQVLMNLFTNAAQAMEKTGGHIDINVASQSISADSANDFVDLPAGDYLKISIGDTGPGIEPNHMDRIFEPYYTTKSVEKGSGMGLAVVHGIVKTHGGAVIVDSRPSHGTKFTLYFPLVKAKPGAKEETIKYARKASGTILFVDDEETIANMTGRMLERLGYKVVTFTNPLKALEQFMLHPDDFDLVITDMTMPQMTGVKLAEKVQKFRKDIPIIISTGYSALLDEHKAKELGIAAFVMKPVEKSDLDEIIRQVMEKAKLPAAD
ncbi:MAG: response regulator [Desulfobacteraceae bacterium]|nr:response regulator [Pseudomonadota bacterium]MCG2752566.1 response regulator [Desulfobacteraceae bacterium]